MKLKILKLNIIILLLLLFGAGCEKEKETICACGIENPQENFCKACFDGCYPVDFDANLTKDCLERD